MEGVSDGMERIERRLTDMRVAQAEGFAELRTRLDAVKDHEPRLRQVEASYVTRQDVHAVVTEATKAVESRMLTLDDVKGVVGEAIEAARRPSWRDVGALVAAISTSTGLVLAVAKLLG